MAVDERRIADKRAHGADLLGRGEDGRIVHFDDDALQGEAAERDVHAEARLNV